MYDMESTIQQCHDKWLQAFQFRGANLSTPRPHATVVLSKLPKEPLCFQLKRILLCIDTITDLAFEKRHPLIHSADILSKPGLCLHDYSRTIYFTSAALHSHIVTPSKANIAAHHVPPPQIIALGKVLLPAAMASSFRFASINIRRLSSSCR